MIAAEARTESRFINLDYEISLPSKLEQFSLSTRPLELKMRDHNGRIDLKSPGDLSGYDETTAREFVPLLADGNNNDEFVEAARGFFSRSDVNEPHSLKLEDEEELGRTILQIYQIMHFHYLLGKKRDFKDSFPRNCCGMSARNLVFSSFEHGFTNAAYAYNHSSDHGYTIYPFLVGRKRITVVADPTSDQLERGMQRNDIQIRRGPTWRYQNSGWNWGANLFPETYLNIERARELFTKEKPMKGMHSTNYGPTTPTDYLRQCFRNPVRREIFLR